MEEGAKRDSIVLCCQDGRIDVGVSPAEEQKFRVRDGDEHERERERGGDTRDE